MQKLAPLMTRTAFCTNCKKAGYPKKHTAYVIYGEIHKSYDLRLHVGNVSKANIGITPHIFFDTHNVIENAQGGGYYVTRCLCGIIGCGFKIKWENDYNSWSLYATQEPDFTFFEKRSMEALKDFKDPGMHLNTVDAAHWNIQDIVSEQQELFQRISRGK